MIYTVHVRPNSRKTLVQRIGEAAFEVRVTAPPKEGKANEKVIEALADFLGKPKRCITILRGATSKVKVVRVEEK